MENVSKNNGSILKKILNKDFIVSAIVPVVICLVFNKFNMDLKGIILAGIWSIGVVIFNYIKDHEINALAVITATFSGVGLLGSIISKNPNVYLLAPIVRDAIYALIFFLSILFKRPLIQVIAEQIYLKNVSEEVKKKDSYRSVWVILTAAWGFLNLSQVVVGIILLRYMSISSYFAIITLYSNISSPLLLAFSIAFPKWYNMKFQ